MIMSNRRGIRMFFLLDSMIFGHSILTQITCDNIFGPGSLGWPNDVKCAGTGLLLNAGLAQTTHDDFSSSPQSCCVPA